MPASPIVCRPRLSVEVSRWGPLDEWRVARWGGKTRKRTLRAMVRATTEYRATVLVLVGDVAMGEALGDATWERIRRSPARHKHLVIGNH